ncbi:TetR/AcrR family transcriptional regulator [Ideonella sp.]|uniref:TetR/AcrR family transcriptional regulator n=1 Tax=Ideonella sp. TaxID=1929293 RepID=UPI002B4AA25E|nr:TetR/AcrR family transcriptional regulator [Ideonella sp.]HJV72521.1 TetR/AcrR family transcriptional regulator [Ideonella sp.]
MTRKAARPGLSAEHIVEAALAQLAERGLERFSLRDVARALGVYPTAVYWYFRSRNELLAAACAHALRPVVPPPRPGDWQRWLRELFTRYRQAMRRHPHLAQLVGAQMLSNASLDFALVEGILQALAQAGCPDEAIVELYNTVVVALCGFATLELAPLPAEDPEGWAEDLQQRVRDIPAADYPALARHLPRLADRSFILRWTPGDRRPMARSFAAYVEVVIAGLAQRIAQARG